ncbi:MAG: hypothetical protein AB1756_06345 [Acidobacteriota bacterium]
MQNFFIEGGEERCVDRVEVNEVIDPGDVAAAVADVVAVRSSGASYQHEKKKK